MTKKQNAWENILQQATEVATEVFNRLDIPAGSYTAADVHKVLTKKMGAIYNRTDLFQPRPISMTFG